ncbi:type III secretion system stator protein SctL [Paraburkholderia bryophila]|uniref:Type 3 secretion system stator protein n=1 Tax=Paraburkholderia bryophila TaxID=420952 RepID=A0A329CXX0_9BURK|nr:type III secretion system stator protein SctL [Paraburkholderia bryophila]RAS39228.1 type III secretion protein L [Paraburkholderia bryophila]
MAIWLKHARSAFGDNDAGQWVARVGASADVIPRATFGELVSIDAAYAALAVEREALLAEARDEAARIVDAGHAQAAEIAAQAQRNYDTASEQGYRDGCDRALADWMQRLADVADAQSQLQIRMRERLAQIVASAVEQIVRVERHEALFERALATVDRIVEGATYLRVAVHPDDYTEAKATFDRLASRWRDLGQPIPLSVIADKRLEPGSCVCESDFGTVDASLDTQLRAMRSAVSRALKRSVEVADAQGEAPPPGSAAEARSNRYADEDSDEDAA